jgi:hypothetical protein
MRILMKIDSTNQDSKWEALAPMEYAHEEELQQLLDTGSAELIPADPSLEEAHVVFARELPTDSGPIDLIGIGSSGSITIMECKLARNHQIKREVVGQVLDYAASLWEIDTVTLSRAFKLKTGSDPFDALRQQFGEEAGSFDEEACRSEVARRLQEGDFRLLVAVDRIDPELRRIIQYVNSRGAAQGLRLVAVEFPRYERGAVQVLVPEAYGDELARPATGAGGAARVARDWTEQEFVEAVAATGGPTAELLAQACLSWNRQHSGETAFGRGKFGPLYLQARDGAGALVKIAGVNTQGYVEVLYNNLSKSAPFDQTDARLEMNRRLNEIEGVRLPERAALDATWPGIQLAALSLDAARSQFIEVFDWVVARLVEPPGEDGGPTAPGPGG